MYCHMVVLLQIPIQALSTVIPAQSLPPAKAGAGVQVFAGRGFPPALE
jgi:hypothetical protein